VTLPPEPAVAPAPAPPPAADPAPEPGAWRRAELRRLRGTRTVPGGLRRAWLAGTLGREAHDAHRRTWDQAGRLARRLPGTRRSELRAVVATVADLAARGRLTTTRIEATFLVLRRNVAFWAARPLPAAGARFVSGTDPVVLQYYPGRGLQIQWLASWGRVGALGRACLERPAGCRRARLRAATDRLAALGARRAGYLAWEGAFPFGGGRAGWASGMIQGTAAQALARSRRALGDPRYGVLARRALGAFELPPPAGVAVRSGRGRHYLMYSFAPDLRILNGNLQAVTGLFDVARLTGSRRARRLFGRGERAARDAVRRYDTGAWSLYALGGRESTLGYHRLVDGFLGDLCRRTERGAYCAASKRFSRYEREPPRIGLAPVRRARAERAVVLRFRLSKISDVVVRVRGRRGEVLRRALRLPRGTHEVSWVPAVPGRYRARVDARGPAGPAGVTAADVRVRESLRVVAERRARERRARERRARERRRAAGERRERAARETGADRPAGEAGAGAGGDRREAEDVPAAPGGGGGAGTDDPAGSADAPSPAAP
jgi:hypothetical protein